MSLCNLNSLCDALSHWASFPSTSEPLSRAEHILNSSACCSTPAFNLLHTQCWQRLHPSLEGWFPQISLPLGIRQPLSVSALPPGPDGPRRPHGCSALTRFWASISVASHIYLSHEISKETHSLCLSWIPQQDGMTLSGCSSSHIVQHALSTLSLHRPSRWLDQAGIENSLQTVPGTSISTYL